MSLIDNSIAESIESLPLNVQKGIFEELKTGYQLEVTQSAINNKLISKANYDIERKSIEGVGRLRMSIDPTYFHHYGQMYGYQCWHDNGFLKDVEKINPGLKVKCGGTRLQVGYSGENKRSTQKYNL